MKDAKGNRVLGKTRWRRFGLAYGISMGVITVVLLLAATGAIALPITITGLPFTVAGDELHGTGFQQWGDVDLCPALDAAHPFSALCSNDGSGNRYKGVAVTSIDHVTGGSGGILNLTQTVCGATGLPGPVAFLKLTITGDSVTATNLVADVTDLTTSPSSTATFGNLSVGAPITSRTGVAVLGQTADSFDIVGSGSPNFQQVAVSTTAGTFAIKHLGLHATLGSSC